MSVIPAQAGIHTPPARPRSMNSRLRGNDKALAAPLRAFAYSHSV